MYTSVPIDAGEVTVILPPMAEPTESNTKPPKSCAQPVAVIGATFANTFLLIISENTVQNEAAIMSRSPIWKESDSGVTFIAMMPAKPSSTPISFLSVSRSFLKNRAEKHI